MPKAVAAPDRSAAPISRSKMLSVKATSTVNGMATKSVGNNETRAMNQVWSKNSWPWKGRRKILRNVASDMETKPPTARAGAASCCFNLCSCLTHPGTAEVPPPGSG
ncbi:Uncharacterised protein [Mycobacteroides abscessus subsp. abscessus]|nr:Uncharacterised protein [Mycobacteroides abscessus subsp. abscessus]